MPYMCGSCVSDLASPAYYTAFIKEPLHVKGNRLHVPVRKKFVLKLERFVLCKESRLHEINLSVTQFLFLVFNSEYMYCISQAKLFGIMTFYKQNWAF